MTASITGLALDKDSDEDDDGIPDVMEVADHYLKTEKLKLEIDKFDHQKTVDATNKDLAEKKLKIDSKKANAPKK
jgi:hypothetical protein